MCGVVGAISTTPDTTRSRIEAALDALRHRGPETHGLETLALASVQCVLGHTRLRIIDLSPDANQPLSNGRGTTWVSYNGEIYNHSELRSELEAAGAEFRSRSDTEVLVHLYDRYDGDVDAMLARLRGMFAFALVDTSRRRVVLARDRLGIKPLYWTHHEGRLAFASECRALVRSGLAPTTADVDTLNSYLFWGVVPGPRTVYSEIHELMPGSYLEWDEGAERHVRWWCPSTDIDDQLGADAERVVRAALHDSVARHLVADRTIGVFLSSGVDSLAVATTAAALAGSDLRSLTVTFPDEPFDEGTVETTAHRLGSRHDRVPVTGTEVAAAMPEIVSAMDQPTLDGVNTWLVCRAAAQAGLVVALSGLGGDELFGGYPTFRRVPQLARISALTRVVPIALRDRLALVRARRRPGSSQARGLAGAPGVIGGYAATRGLFAPTELPDHGRRALDTLAQTCGLDGVRDPRLAVGCLELAHYLPNQLLRDTDVMSMAHSLEVRVPLIDDVLVNVVTALPPAIRFEPDKQLLTRAAALRESLRKQPFALPFASWLRGPLRDDVRRGLLSADLPLGDVIPVPLRDRVWHALEAGRVHWSRPWALAVVRLWAEANGVDT
ncbi:MAG: asparagine synthase (glutamine-hydrolyzing) [Acidimicrobiia bacterium]